MSHERLFRQKAYSRWEHLEGVPLAQVGLFENSRREWNGIGTNSLAYFFIARGKKFDKIHTRAHCYIIFYDHNLLVFLECFPLPFISSLV